MRSLSKFLPDYHPIIIEYQSLGDFSEISIITVSLICKLVSHLYQPSVISTFTYIKVYFRPENVYSGIMKYAYNYTNTIIQ